MTANNAVRLVGRVYQHVGWYSLPAIVFVTMLFVAMFRAAPQVVFTLALSGAAFYGYHLSSSVVLSRETRGLPVSSRERWVATWLTFVVVVPSFLAAAAGMEALITMVLGVTPPYPHAGLLVVVYTALYGGTIVAIVPIAERPAVEFQPSFAMHGPPRPSVRGLAPVILLPGAALVAPFWFGQMLPAHIGLAGIATMLAGSIALAASIWSLLWTPAEPWSKVTRTPQLTSWSIHTAPDVPRVRRWDRFTGPARVLTPRLMGSFTVTLAGFLCVAVGQYLLRGHGDLRTASSSAGLLLLDPLAGANLELVNPIGIAVFISIMSSSWAGFDWMFHRLPLSRLGRMLLFLSCPIITVFGVWMASITFHLFVRAWPVDPAHHRFIALAAATALGQAMVLRVPPHVLADSGKGAGVFRSLLFGIGLSATGLLVAAALWLMPDATPLGQYAGASLLLAAALLVHAFSTRHPRRHAVPLQETR